MGIYNFILENFIDSSYCIGYRKTQYNLWDEKETKMYLMPQSLRYWYADPIPIRIGADIYVFVEKYDRIKKRGYIAVSKYKKNRLGRPKTIIKTNTHLSFPTVFAYKNNYYMIPESSETNSIEIYKMGDNAYEWRHYYSISINRKVVDIICDIKENNIILLGGLLEDNPLYTKRLIIQLDNLSDKNKISFKIGYEDTKASLYLRNGSVFFVAKSRKYLVTQESTNKDYGMYILLHEINNINLEHIDMSYIDKKTADDFEIQGLNKVIYRKIGTHTYGYCDGLEVIDISLTKISILPFLRKIGLMK